MRLLPNFTNEPTGSLPEWRHWPWPSEVCWGALPRSTDQHAAQSTAASPGPPSYRAPIVPTVEQDDSSADGGVAASKTPEREVAARSEHRPGVGGRLKSLKSIAVSTCEGDKQVVETRSSHFARSILPYFAPLATIRLLI